MKITGYTGLYGIVANPIKHSISPLMHNQAFQSLNMNDVYLAFEVKEEYLKTFVDSAKALPIKGFNVSMPYKTKIIPYLDELTKQAKLVQAVNTVKNCNGRLIGHITDGIGFMQACFNKNWHVDNQKVVILGGGGAALAIIVELAFNHAKEIIVYNRSDKPYIKELNQRLDTTIILKKLNDEALKEDLKDAYLLIQTTNVGMIPYEEECLISEELLPDHIKIADIIYKPKMSKLLQIAQSKGLDYMNGEAMLLYQGAVSFEYWTNQKMPIEEVKKILEME